MQQLKSFCDIFIIGSISIGGEPPGYANDLITIYCTNFKSQSTSSVLMRQNTFDKKKNYLGKMLIEQIIELELKGPGPKQIILEWLFTAKNIAGGNVPCFFHLGQVSYKI